MPAKKVFELDIAWINSIQVDDAELKSYVSTGSFSDQANISKHSTPSLLIKAISCVDLSLLFGDETPDAIKKLCQQAGSPLGVGAPQFTEVTGGAKVQCAAICVYPLRVQDTIQGLAAQGDDKSIRVASVAAGFPSGQFPLHTRLAEIYYAVATGAHEIDVVIDRSLVLRGLWSQLYDELVQMRQACGDTVLKVILSVTECGSWTNVYKASAVAMLAGADFIKTSTGKEVTTMTIHESLVMCRAIKDFHNRKGVKVGLKPAGGVRTVEHCVSWVLMVKEVLGEEWVDPKLFRIGTAGTSALLKNISEALLKK